MWNDEKRRNGSYLEKAKYNVRTRLKRKRFLHIYCPKCSAPLIQDKNVQLKAVTKNGEEALLEIFVYLNVYEAEQKYQIVTYPDTEIQDVKCPHCNQSIVRAEVRCEICGSLSAELLAAAVQFRVPFLFCLKKGCHWHRITSEDELRLIKDSSREW